MNKNRQVFRIIVAMAILLAVSMIAFLIKFIWKVWDNNAFEIITELIFPAGRLYFSDK